MSWKVYILTRLFPTGLCPCVLPLMSACAWFDCESILRIYIIECKRKAVRANKKVDLYTNTNPKKYAYNNHSIFSPILCAKHRRQLGFTATLALPPHKRKYSHLSAEIQNLSFYLSVFCCCCCCAATYDYGICWLKECDMSVRAN